MRQSHRAGETLFVDYAGQTMPVVGALTEIREAAIFIAVLGASNYTFAEATWSQSLPDWIGSHVRAFAALVGCPRSWSRIISRPPSAGPMRYEPTLTRTYAELAQHYGVAIVPARPARPRDKAKVEVVCRWWNGGFSRACAITPLLAPGAEHRDCRPAGDTQPAALQETARLTPECSSLDRPALRPLPAQPLRMPSGNWCASTLTTTWKWTARTARPYSLVKQQLVRLGAQVAEIFRRANGWPAIRAQPTRAVSTVDAHMPKAHRHYVEWTPQRLVL